MHSTIDLIIVEDNEVLREALSSGLTALKGINVLAGYSKGEDILESKWDQLPQVIIMDVALAGDLNGIETAVALRKEYPRLPIVFYSIQDDDCYYRDFLNAGILTHYAYVRKSSYLIPVSLVPLLKDAMAGKSFIEPEIARRVQEVRQKEKHNPMDLLEPNEQRVIHLLAQGFSNEQIAQQLGFRDARAVSRTNGQIYTAWGLNQSTRDEKIARTRAVLIFQSGQLMHWRDDGTPCVMDENGDWVILKT